MKPRVALVIMLALAASGCVRKKNKPPMMRLVALGEHHGCGQTVAGATLCWGANARMQVGDGTRERRLLGVRIASVPSGVRAFALGGVCSCALADDGKVVCWGADAAPAVVPVPRATELVAGSAHACARAEDAVRCWTAGSATPREAAVGGGRVVAMAAGGARTCLALESGGGRSVRCFGGGAALSPPSGAPVLDGVAVAKLAATDAAACAITDGGELHCWSSEEAAARPGARPLAPAKPVRVDLPEAAAEVGLGLEHACVRTRSGTVACWGRNDRHQLSDGTTEPSDRPKLVYGLIGAEQLAVSAYGACARLKGGEVRCWGGNAEGELADGSTVEHDVPMPIRAPAPAADSTPRP